MGGRPNPGTKKDKRLADNKPSPKRTHRPDPKPSKRKAK